MARLNVLSHDSMPAVRLRMILALALSLGVHAGLVRWTGQPPPPPAEPEALRVTLAPPPKPEANPLRLAPPPSRAEMKPRVADAPPPPAPALQPATMAAPPAPTAEDWQLASTYTLKNSKRYRYNWGQQVRSMMGTAVAGEREGLVRVQVEIAPDGTLARVDVLWSTSALVEQLALQAIRAMPPLPPTPTGKPLIFEKTIALLPFETGWPPSYQLDCLPDPAPHKNPYAWDGVSPPPLAKREHRPPPPEGCPPDSTAPTIEEEEASMKRQMDQWRWAR